MRRSRTSLALAAVLSPALAVPAPSHAVEAVAQWAFDRAGTCMGALSGDSSGDWGAGSRCIRSRVDGLVVEMGGRLGSYLVEEAARFVTEQGRGVFGEHFSLVHRMSWSPLGQGLAGELDAVIPLAFRGGVQTGADAEALHGSAFFLQQGVTRWTDAHGFRRHDVRLGTAFRFTLPHFAGADVVGATALVQENVERGHQRFVLGTDYAGRWGHASLQHYLPTTEWLPGRAGYEERAVGGTELSVRLDLTTTVSLDTAMGRWERGDAGRSALDGHLGLGWKPHPYLRLDAMTGIGPGAGGGSFMLSLNVPFGGPRKRARWEGLGTFALAGDDTTAADLWRPVENVGRIRTIERVARQETGMDDVTVRFLQSSAETGGTVEGSIGSPDDVDFFKMQLTDPGTVTFWTTGEADTAIALLDGEANDLSPTVSDGRVSKATTLDEVFARVSGREGSTGRYALHNTFAEGQRQAQASEASFQDCPECPEMVVVPAGSFMMGESSDRAGYTPVNNLPVHRVSIPSFAVGVYEVTYEEWDACLSDGGCNGYRPPFPEERGRLPVRAVNWFSAKAYVRWLSQKTGEEYRLPSEAEWEYVARAGTTTGYWWGDSLLPFRDRLSLTQVGSYSANPFGLYDVHGNVGEIVEDCWHDNYEGAPSDGSAWVSGEHCGQGSQRGLRVVRGGWGARPLHFRSSYRLNWPRGGGGSQPFTGHGGHGFRVARTL